MGKKKKKGEPFRRGEHMSKKPACTVEEIYQNKDLLHDTLTPALMRFLIEEFAVHGIN